MTLGTFLIFKCLKAVSDWLYRPVEDMSKLSYGIYLMHIFILGIVYSIIGMSMFTPLNMIVVALTTFICSYLLCKGLSLCRFGKYIIG